MPLNPFFNNLFPVGFFIFLDFAHLVAAVVKY